MKWRTHSWGANNIDYRDYICMWDGITEEYRWGNCILLSCNDGVTVLFLFEMNRNILAIKMLQFIYNYISVYWMANIYTLNKSNLSILTDVCWILTLMLLLQSLRRNLLPLHWNLKDISTHLMWKFIQLDFFGLYSS